MTPELAQSLFYLICIGLVGAFLAQCLVWIGRRGKPQVTQPTKQPTQSDAPATSQNVAGYTVALKNWLDRVNNHPDKVPHLAATGATGSGKTTLITAVLTTREGKVLICTPKPDDDWGGVPFVTIDDDLTFTSIQRTVAAVDTEMRQRWLQVKKAKEQKQSYTPEWLTVVIDDYPFMKGQIKELSNVVLSIARMGRSMRIRLILLAQEASVKAWGFEGEGEARENFVFMDLTEEHWNKGGAMMYRWGKQPEYIDTRRVFDLSRRPITSHRWYDVSSVLQPVRTSTDDTDGAFWQQSYQYEPVRKGSTPDTEALDDDTLIWELVRRGKSANLIHEVIGGTRATVLDKVRTMKEQQGV